MDSRYDVIIAGYGPTGAVLAACLGGYGVRTLVVDPQSEIYPLPRAVHFDDEIMQVFQRLGIAEAILDHATPSTGYEFRAADGQVLLRFSEGAFDAPSGWKSGYLFHQPGIEKSIRDSVRGLASVDVRLGAAIDGVTPSTDGVSCRLSAPDGISTVEARYLIAADGASSTVRAMLNIELDDYDFDEPWLVIDATVHDPSRLPTINLQICDPARPTTCVFIGKGRHRWEFMLLPGEHPDLSKDDAFVAGLLAPWGCDGAITVERRAVYRFHGLVAKQWRCGPVLLAGDAAHQMPPFAGQGMCSGIRDAVNLAWKIDSILSGHATDALLDSYQREREPNVRAYIGLAIGMGQIVCTLDPEMAAQRDAAMLAERAAGSEPLKPPELPPIEGVTRAGSPAVGTRFFQPWSDNGGVRVGLETVLGRGAWLIVRDTPPAVSTLHNTVVVSLFDPVLVPFRTSLETWLDKHDADGVLVRPDRYVFGTGNLHELSASWIDTLQNKMEMAIQ
jgi:3-(3-hydroxy-phenyl)propionate hydroxylase